MEGSYFQRAKDCTNDFESCLVIVWAIDVDDFIFEGCKRPVEELKRIGWCTFIVSLLSEVIVGHLKYSLPCKLSFRASAVLQVQCHWQKYWTRWRPRLRISFIMASK